MGNIFLEEPYTKRGGGTIPKLLSKESKLSLSFDQ